MKYTYYYQTKQNENKTGVIDARDRADAYTKLRKQGLRPYRVVGDDPAKWRQWMPFAGLFVAVFVVSAIMPHVVCSAEQGRDNLPMKYAELNICLRERNIAPLSKELLGEGVLPEGRSE